MNKWMNKLCASIAISGIMFCPDARCTNVVKQPNFVGNTVLRIFDGNGEYTSDAARTVYTDNMAGEKNVKIRVECNQVNNILCYLKSDEFPDQMFFSTRIGRRGEQWWNYCNYGESITVHDSAEEIGVRIEMTDYVQERIKAHPGVEFSADITIVREVEAA